MKTCSQCGVEKPLDGFYKQRGVKDGRAAACKDCTRIQQAAYQRANREKVNARERARYARKTDEEKRAEFERSATWAQGEGREKYLAIRKRSREKNKEKNAAAWAAYYEKNREELAAKRKLQRDGKPRKRNPEGMRRDRERRRARMLNAFVEDVPYDYILQRDLGVCGICDKQIIGENPEIDHIIPLATGGMHEKTNCQLAHMTCNRRKWSNADFRLSDAA